MFRNKLIFGDNLEVMRELPNRSVNIICADPPFNSGRKYCTFFDNQAHEEAFSDTWNYDIVTQDIREDIRVRTGGSEEDHGHIYGAVENALTGFDYLLQKKRTGNKGAMRSYLTYMAPRLIEAYGLLADNGSFYLHCDPSASHYLKGMMDAIFDQANNGKNKYFQNDIIWSYRRWSGRSARYQRMHDNILFYTKGPDYTWNQPMEAKAPGSRMFKQWNVKDPVTGKMKTHYDKSIPDTETNMRDVWEISRLQSKARERLGYPTQKPVKLYKRMIEASSNEGDVVFDPFCGCGTTIDAAHGLKRNWIGIDLTICALDPMQYRLMDRYDLRSYIDYDVEGYPTNMEELREFAKHPKRKYDTEIWMVTRVGLRPTKKTRDGGIDGVGHFTYWVPEGMRKTDARIMAEAKTGNFNLKDVGYFRTAIQDNKATAGVFITLDPVTKGMRELADREGEFEHNGIKYPRLQFWQITQEYFDNPDSINKYIRLPKRIEVRKKAERHDPDNQMEMDVAAG